MLFSYLQYSIPFARIVQMGAKYRNLFMEMLENHRDLFLDFKEVHDKYVENEEEYKKEFNDKGAKIVEIIRDYEMKLTAQQNKGQFSKFSSKLSDKYWEQVRGLLPRIDFVGVK